MAGLDPRAMQGLGGLVAVPSPAALERQEQRQDVANMVNTCMNILAAPSIREREKEDAPTKALVNTATAKLQTWLDGFKTLSDE